MIKLLETENSKGFSKDPKGFLRYPSVSPEELITLTTQFSADLLKTKDINTCLDNGLSVQDLASEARIKILESKRYPRINKGFIYSTVRSVMLDAVKKPRLSVVNMEPVPENTEEYNEILNTEELAEVVLANLSGAHLELYTALVIDGIPSESLADHYGLTQRSINRKLYELRLHIEDILGLS